jgi:hypothetical protein
MARKAATAKGYGDSLLQHVADKPDRHYSQTDYDQHIRCESDAFAAFVRGCPSVHVPAATARRLPPLEELGHRIVPVGPEGLASERTCSKLGAVP